jgi:hypothetical protein
MMELEAGVWDVAKAGNELILTKHSQKQQSHSPTYPVYFIHQHPAWHLQCTGQQWAGQREQRAFTSMYKCTHRINEKEGIAIPKNGDLTADVSTQSSTYIKTSTNEEKFRY